MNAWCPPKEELIDVFKGEMDSTSPESEFWIKGFLAGNQPSPPAGGRDKKGNDQSVWKQAVELFTKTDIGTRGIAPALYVARSFSRQRQAKSANPAMVSTSSAPQRTG